MNEEKKQKKKSKKGSTKYYRFFFCQLRQQWFRFYKITLAAVIKWRAMIEFRIMANVLQVFLYSPLKSIKSIQS
jgi:hypothetical protein